MTARPRWLVALKIANYHLDKLNVLGLAQMPPLPERQISVELLYPKEFEGGLITVESIRLITIDEVSGAPTVAEAGDLYRVILGLVQNGCVFQQQIPTYDGNGNIVTPQAPPSL